MRRVVGSEKFHTIQIGSMSRLGRKISRRKYENFSSSRIFALYEGFGGPDAILGRRKILWEKKVNSTLFHKVAAFMT
jgi:hypothetical protein